jgi:hypothetical protein
LVWYISAAALSPDSFSDPVPLYVCENPFWFWQNYKLQLPSQHPNFSCSYLHTILTLVVCCVDPTYDVDFSKITSCSYLTKGTIILTLFDCYRWTPIFGPIPVCKKHRREWRSRRLPTYWWST